MASSTCASKTTSCVTIFGRNEPHSIREFKFGSHGRICVSLGDRRLIRFIIVGGFLGAGKTTTIARLARHYQEQGLNVAIVTNDQGSDLVDTYRLLAYGYNVGEISGACFCGNVDSLVATIDQLGMTARPQ